MYGRITGSTALSNPVWVLIEYQTACEPLVDGKRGVGHRAQGTGPWCAACPSTSAQTIVASNGLGQNDAGCDHPSVHPQASPATTMVEEYMGPAS